MVASVRRAFRRVLYGEPIVVVSGLPRSGTSMAMRMLEAAGVPLVTDGERRADEDNPKGYFEIERVKGLAQEADRSWLKAARGKAIKVISQLLRDLPADNNYKVVFMIRNLSEVLASQAKMLQRRGETSGSSDERMIELYEDHLWKVNRLLRRSAHIEALELHYSAVLADPRGQAARLSEFLGGLDVDKMVAAVEPSLYRNRAAS